jgi:hypothetical protein
MAVGRTENCIRHGGGNRCEFDQVRFCRHQFSPTGELGYRGARRVRTQVHCISVPLLLLY